MFTNFAPQDEIYALDSWSDGHGAASHAAMTPPILFLVLLLKHAGSKKRKVIHIKQPAVHAKPSAPRCGDKCMAARREAVVRESASASLAKKSLVWKP